MARRSGLVATMSQLQREAERRQAAQFRAQQAAARAAQRAKREYERAQAASEKERQRLYTEARAAEVAADNEQLEQAVQRLERLMIDSLATAHTVDFAALRRDFKLVPFS